MEREVSPPTPSCRLSAALLLARSLAPEALMRGTATDLLESNFIGVGPSAAGMLALVMVRTVVRSLVLSFRVLRKGFEEWESPASFGELLELCN